MSQTLSATKVVKKKKKIVSSEKNTFKIFTSSSTTTDTSTVLQNWSETLPVTHSNKFVYTFGIYGRFQLVKYGRVGTFEASYDICTKLSGLALGL